MNWDATVEELGPRLFRYFRGSCVRETASDLVQETLVRLVRKVEEGGYDSRRGSLSMLAFGIAHHVRQEAIRSKRRGEAQEAPPSLTAPPLDEWDQVRALRAAIDGLAETQKQILLLLIDEELTLAEIAELTKMPLNTVKSHVHRAKEVLRRELDGPEGDGHG